MKNGSKPTTPKPSDCSLQGRKEEDLTGRDRILSNVLWGWGSYIVVLATGFIMPRLIDRHIGQLNLGIWDFSWSLVNYLSYSGMGIGSSINRYVAKYRAQRDIQMLKGAVSSVFLIQSIISLLILGGSILIALLLPVYFSHKLGQSLSEAQWVIVLLGASLSIEEASGTFKGIVTGCHRWDIHNGLNTATKIGTFVGMVMVLLMGTGLKAMAASYLFITTVFAAVRVIVAMRICPEAKISLSQANMLQAKKMLFFGWKTFAIKIPPLFMAQTSSVLITATLGPSILAVFSRPLALVRHMEALVNRFSFVITPMASSLKSIGHQQELKEFFYESCKTGVALTLPIVIIFVFWGNEILYLWMGENYTSGYTLPLLAVGFLLPIALGPAVSVLVGMNRHGQIAIVALALMLFVFGCGILVCKLSGWSLNRFAILITAPLTLGQGLLIPLYTSRLLKIGYRDFFCRIFCIPFLCNIPMIVVCVMSKISLSSSPFVSLLTGVTVASLITGLLYLRYLLPRSYLEKFLNLLPKKHPGPLH